MKKTKSYNRYELHVTRYFFKSLNFKSLNRFLLFCFSAFPLFCSSVLHAQSSENKTLDTDTVQIIELEVTAEIEKMVVTEIKNMLEKCYQDFGMKNKSQFENLHIGKPIPLYEIVNDKFEAVYTYNVSHVADKVPLSLKFTNNWSVPIMSDRAPLLFGTIQFSIYGGNPFISLGNYNIIEHFSNYEHKDLLIGSVGINPSSKGMDYMIIRKEHKDIFVQVYDEATGEYFKSEYSFSEVVNLMKERAAKERAAQRRYFEKIANKSELIMTPEIKEMVINSVINCSDQVLSNFRIKSRTQLENLQLGKPIPEYWIDLDNNNLIFVGRWNIPVISANEEPLVLVKVCITEEEQYIWEATGAAEMAQHFHNFKDNAFVIGSIGRSPRGLDYLIVRKDNKNIFVETYDYATREYFVNEYSLSEIINLSKE